MSDQGYRSIDPRRLIELLDYNPETGDFIWKYRALEWFKSADDQNRWNIRRAGQRAFTAREYFGYRHGSLLGHKVLAHRVAYALTFGEWPAHGIDHINGAKDDNRIGNLRAADQAINGKNRSLGLDNSSGAIGVSQHPKTQRWRARIRVNGKLIHLGYFGSFEEATSARAAASATHGFHPNHGRRLA